MPITEKKPDRTPTIGRRRKKDGVRKELKRENRSGPPIPQFSRKPLPDLDDYPKERGTKEPKVQLCPKKHHRGPHEVDWSFAGWAKGYGDGTFDVSCRLCGEVGRVELKIHGRDVAWG